MKEKLTPNVKIIPIEEIVTKDGIHTIVEVQGRTKEDVDATIKELDSAGIPYRRLTETEKINHSQRQTFGFTNWDNCGWNPTGPKPNWAAPEDPSKN